LNLQTINAEGKTLLEATLTASKQRLRPILMTSLAFTLGVVPLMLASGASDSTQHAIGTGVFGMISATLLAVFFVPVFFVVITRFTGMRKRRHKNNRND
jgi:multidrug efflux pump